MPTQQKMAIFFYFILSLALVYLFILAFMYVFQRHFTFNPSGANPFKTSYKNFETLNYQTPMGLNLRGLYAPAQQGKPTIVYFQGNAGNIADRLYKTEPFLARGYGFALIGYRGYSGNPGQPSEANFYEDARHAIAKLHEKGVAEKDMILYGESIGSGVATQMATEMPHAKALILEAPFTSATAIAKYCYWYLPVEYLLHDKFENDRKIASIQMPILIMHGTKDKTVPYEYGRTLFSKATAPVKKFATLEGAGHADVYNFGAAEVMNAFLDQI